MNVKYETSKLDIVGGTAFGRYHKISTQETFNMMISDGALVPYPGYQLRSNIYEGGESRAIYPSTRFLHLIVVIGNKVFIINDDFSATEVGQINTSNGPVYIAENDANQICIVDLQDLYIFNWVNNTFAQIFIDFVPNYIEFMDGYFIAGVKDSVFWRLSGLNNGTTWPNTINTVGRISTKSDNVQAVVRLDRELLVIGKITAEIWRDTGASPFPFQRTNSLSIDYGTIAPQSIASGFGLIVWLASNEKSGLTIRYSSGSRTQEITNDGFNFLFDQLINPSEAIAFLFEEDGHIIYQFTFPDDNKSYAYDFSEKAFYTITDENLNFSTPKRVAFFNDALYFLSFTKGALYEMGTEFTNYDGEIIPRIRKTRNFRLPNAGRFIVPQATLTIEQGNAENEQRVLLSLSKDGGESYGTIQSKTLAPLGKRANKLEYWSLGAANDLVFQWRFESLDRFVIIDGEFTYYRGGMA